VKTPSVRVLPSWMAAVVGLATAWASAQVTFKRNDPGIWYYPSEAPLACQTLSCKNPGSSLTISTTVQRSVQWSMEAGVTGGVDWGVVSAELNTSFGIQVGSSTGLMISSTLTPLNCYTCTVCAYAAYQKKIYNVRQGSQTRQVAVFVPTGGVAQVWSNCVFNRQCPGCGQDGPFPPPPASALPSCMSASPLLPAMPTECLMPPGSWIIGDLSASVGGILRVDPASGALTTVVAGRPATFFNWVILGGDNRSLLGNASTPLFHLLNVTLSGALTTVGAIGAAPSPNGADLDQDGSIVASTSAANGLHRVVPGVSVPIVTTPATLNNVCIDQDTGDYVLGIFSAGQLLRVNRLTSAISTIAVGLGSVSGVDFEPQTGTFVVSTFTGPVVRRVTPAGVISPVSATPAGANAVKVDDETGNLLVGGGITLTNMTPAGVVLTSHALVGPAGLSISATEIAGSRKVSGSGPALPGSAYSYNFSFPASPGAGYVAAASTGLRPGIPLGDGTGRVINLDVTSPLLPLSIGGIPGLTTGFSGVLSTTGGATGTLLIPLGFPPGIRVFVSAVALNGSMPTGLDTANTWAFTTN